MDRFIGQTLSNRYEIIEKIGSGGMSNIYKAKCNVLNRYVALKILKEEFANNAEFTKGFKTEAQAVALLSHPNIVSIYDVGSYKNLPFIVMEFIEGITLKEYIKQKGPLKVTEVIHFVTQILKALEHAHSRQIIHRDIKPQNIMLLRDGTIKVADFGIARFTMSTTQTMTESAIGSAHYLSPEQAKGSVTDQRSDLYSVGIVMYEMLTGRVPFDGENPVMVAIMHIQNNPAPITQYNKDIPKAIESIISKAMMKEQSRRYQSATQMLADIETYKKDPSIKFEYKQSYDGNQHTQYFNKIPQKSANVQMHSSTEHRSSKKHNQKTEKNRRIVMIAGVVLLCFVLFYVGSNAVRLFNNLITTGTFNPSTAIEVSVPDFTGLDPDVIKDDEEITKGLVINVEGSDYSSEIEKGLIMSQDPTSEHTVRPGSTINVTISEGQKMIEIPDVIETEYRQTKLDLESQGFTVDVQEEYSDTVVEGYVTRTDPKIGTEVVDGGIVTLYVSRGKEVVTIEMPEVTGHSIEDARQMLISAGFSIKEVKQVESSSPKGVVVRQSIAAGEMAEEKSEVTLEVSAGMVTSKDILINLPLTPSAFTVRVLVNGVEQYSGEHKASEGSITVTVEGSGSSLVEVYVNTRLHASDIIQFN